MKIIQRLRQWIGGRTVGGDAISFKNWLNFVDSTLPIPSDRQLENAYRQSSIVGSCVDEAVDAVASLELHVDGAPYIEMLLEKPTPRTDWQQFVGDLTRRFLVCGASFIWKQRSGGVLTGIRSVPTSAVDWREDDRFALSIDGTQEVLDWKDLPGMMQESISQTHDWMSRLDAAWADIQLDMQRTAYQRTVLENLADASLVIESEMPSSMMQRNDLKESVRQSVGGTGRGGVLVLPPGFKASTPGQVTDIALPGLGKTCEARICACLNVPPVLVGLEAGLEHMTYSNYAEARESFYTETILPLALRIGGFLTAVLLVDEGIRGKIRLERSEESKAATAPPQQGVNANGDGNADAADRAAEAE